MPSSSGTLPADDEEVQITFARSRGRGKRTIPVWFTLNEGNMELLPMYGLKTKWFIDIEKSGGVSLKVKDWKVDAKPRIVRDPRAVDGIKRRFAGKYGENKVRRYYPTSEVALEVPL